MGLSVDGETSVNTFWVTTIVQILESSRVVWEWAMKGMNFY